jgi:hypothetical protein
MAGSALFADVAALIPQPGVVAYDVNVPFWSDNATKTRWFTVPNLTQNIAFNRESPWLFPTGTVWIKHFELQMTNGSCLGAPHRNSIPRSQRGWRLWRHVSLGRFPN